MGASGQRISHKIFQPVEKQPVGKVTTADSLKSSNDDSQRRGAADVEWQTGVQIPRPLHQRVRLAVNHRTTSKRKPRPLLSEMKRRASSQVSHCASAPDRSRMWSICGRVFPSATRKVSTPRTGARCALAASMRTSASAAGKRVNPPRLIARAEKLFSNSCITVMSPNARHQRRRCRAVRCLDDPGRRVSFKVDLHALILV